MSEYSIYEAFNARNLTPEQVALSFIEPPDFRELAGNYSVVVRGPRGSGKTTMFKMLTARALKTWADRRSGEQPWELPFAAVYIPTDVHWHHQVKEVADELESRPELSLRFSQAAVTVNVLSAVVQAIEDRLRFEVPHLVRREVEARIVPQIFDAWRLGTGVPILPALQSALTQRMNSVFRSLNRALRTADPARALERLPGYFDLDYFAAARVGCELFDQVLTDSGERVKPWALCFDELELAPRWLQSRLFQELRSVDQRFIFKLSTSPLPDLTGVLPQATQSQDFRVIQLWPEKKKDTREFCERLTRAALERRFKIRLDPAEIFGHSTVYQENDESEYQPSSEMWRGFEALAAFDDSFKRLLLRHQIDLGQRDAIAPGKMDAVLRKAKPIAYFRLAFRKHRAGPVRKRSRKLVSKLYHGVEAIYDVTDGNPRWLQGLLDELFAEIAVDSEGRPRPLSAEIQARVLKRTASKFAAYVQAAPQSIGGIEPAMDLYSLLEVIGQRFHDAMTNSPFRLDPWGSFKVDSRTPPAVRKLLRTAAYYGAIILIEPRTFLVGTDLHDHRFRLSYLLAVKFNLPLRLYKSTALSTVLPRQVLSQQGERHKPQSAVNQRQRRLPLGNSRRRNR